MSDALIKDSIDLQEIRDYFIEKIASANTAKDEYVKSIADELFSCGLTMYSGDFSFDSLIYNAFAKSRINPNISLHPEQLNVIQNIKEHDAVIVSAPTSFGKTFCVFEYIARYHPQNVVLIVPTLALSREYQNQIIKHDADLYNYKIYTAIDDKDIYDFENERNLFILTHEKAVSNSNYEKISTIDFLVIDEVYKLDETIKDDRTLVLNIAFYYLTQKAKKYCLLAPFIRDIKNKDSLNKNPEIVYLNYSPVVNHTKDVLILDEKDRMKKVLSLVKEHGSKKTMIYIPNPREINKFIEEELKDEEGFAIEDEEISNFVEWAKDEIHPSWSVVKAIEKGYLIHHGAMPLGIRDYLLSIFDDSRSDFKKLLCTTTLFEGVNVNAEYLIISKATKQSMKKRSQHFNAFEFYNLVGRTGRLFKYYVGECDYIRTNEEPFFNKKDDSQIEIEFEITKNGEDIDIQINDGKNSKEATDYLNSIGLSIDDFNKRIGAPMRLDTFKMIRNNFEKNKNVLLGYINSNDSWHAINEISKMCNLQKKKDPRIIPGVINEILRSKNASTSQIVNNLMKTTYISRHFSLEEIIENVIKIKNGYLENSLLIRSQIIELFFEKEGYDKGIADYIHSKISVPIEAIYALNSPERKMLRSIGVYDSDVDTIVNHIGEGFTDLTELKQRLIKNYNTFISLICFISRFEINKFIA